MILVYSGVIILRLYYTIYHGGSNKNHNQSAIKKENQTKKYRTHMKCAKMLKKNDIIRGEGDGIVIQDIAPKKFNNEYQPRTAKSDDIVLLFQGDQILLAGDGTEPEMLTQEQVKLSESELYYLFSIDETGFFLAETSRTEQLKDELGLMAHHTNIFRSVNPGWKAFGGTTAAQLYRWKSSRIYCGHCGEKMEPHKRERAMVCPECGLVEYPKISPATITAIVDGDRVLMARNRLSTYTRWGLIAGFVEIGETFEETVKREAMEEVGLTVKNVTYFKSQPWGFSDTEMVGFFAELDGDAELTIEEEELSEARWFSMDEMPESVSDISIGHELMEAVRTGKYREYLKK